MHLYETHVPVADTELAREFYTRVVGLPFAYRDPTRDIVFLWATSKEQGMIGLWGTGRHSRITSTKRAASRFCRFPGTALCNDQKVKGERRRDVWIWREGT